MKNKFKNHKLYLNLNKYKLNKHNKFKNNKVLYYKKKINKKQNKI